MLAIAVIYLFEKCLWSTYYVPGCELPLGTEGVEHLENLCPSEREGN